ncbi:MAG: hypothetical protein H9Q65_02120 [Spiroplasma ixodetis]|nr:hypothetical protein [Spiroplasma ixodetis]MBP1528042.1 hypothetical protein [Spiroplasma ixodetis]
MRKFSDVFKKALEDLKAEYEDNQDYIFLMIQEQEKLIISVLSIPNIEININIIMFIFLI